MNFGAPSKLTYKGLIKTIGPGILYAGAAIGASHLVQSTRAGASYGFELVWAVILINIFKYPFFEYGHRFTAATGKTLIEGYRALGKWAVSIFFILNFLTGIVNFAAVALVTTGLAASFFGFDINSTYLSVSLLVSLLLMLYVGKYKFLDGFMKALIVLLSIATITAFLYAMFGGQRIPTTFLPTEIWDAAGITFLIALMGWMPTPIEASTWTSLWALEKEKQTNYKPEFREYMADFNLGYIASAILALFFLGLGALVMYGSEENFSNSGVVFAGQIVSLYSSQFGLWSAPLISGIAFITMFTTALTVIDGYPRAIAAAIIEIFEPLKRQSRNIFWLIAILLALLAALLISFFANEMKTFLDFATIISFLAAPFFATLNYKVVTSEFMPVEYIPRKWLKILSILGVIFLSAFSLVFIYARIYL